MKSFKEMNSTVANTVMIVDSLNLAFRYYHTKARDFATDYMRTVESLKKSYKCDKLIIAGDTGSSSFRKAIYPEYKANRKEKYATQTPEEAAYFEEFLLEVKSILEMYRHTSEYPVITFPGVEADDIAAYICSIREQLGIEHIWLISSDKDWCNLISPNISQFSYVTRKEYTVDGWLADNGYPIEDYISIKCLQGDTGDNVPGVPKIGPKTALKLLEQYGSALEIAASLPLPGKYVYIKNLNEFGAENIMRNYQLMDLVTFCKDALGDENAATIDKVMKEYING